MKNYKQSHERWQKLWKKVEGSLGWETPWFSEDSTNGNPIFTAVNYNSKRGIRIIEHNHNNDWGNTFTHYYDKSGVGNNEDEKEIDELVISCYGDSNDRLRVLGLMKTWVCGGSLYIPLTEQEINDKIDLWHEGESNVSLPVYLGLTEVQYKAFVEGRAFLKQKSIPDGRGDGNYEDLKTSINLICEEFKITDEVGTRIPPDDLLEYMREKLGYSALYNSEYGDNIICRCGHTYYRHFDTYEGMRPTGCKYCGCGKFIPLPDEYQWLKQHEFCCIEIDGQSHYAYVCDFRIHKGKIQIEVTKSLEDNTEKLIQDSLHEWGKRKGYGHETFQKKNKNRKWVNLFDVQPKKYTRQIRCIESADDLVTVDKQYTQVVSWGRDVGTNDNLTIIDNSGNEHEYPKAWFAHEQSE